MPCSENNLHRILTLNTVPYIFVSFFHCTIADSHLDIELTSLFLMKSHMLASIQILE